MLVKLTVGLLLSCLSVVANTITQSELLKFQTTTRTFYSKDKFDNSYIKGYLPSQIEKLNSYKTPKPKTQKSQKKLSIADKYAAELRLNENYNPVYGKKLKPLQEKK